MQVTVFSREAGGRVVPDVIERPAWQPFEEWEGDPLEHVDLVEVLKDPAVHVQLVRIATGGHFVMHSSPDLAFCQVVSGSGKLRLPDGSDLAYAGPELYVFRPHTLHEWHEVTSDTLLSVCLVPHVDQPGDLDTRPPSP